MTGANDGKGNDPSHDGNGAQGSSSSSQGGEGEAHTPQGQSASGETRTPNDPVLKLDDEDDVNGVLRDREIFSVGTWKGSRTVTADRKFLDQIVMSYANLNSKTTGFAIPIKLGHNSKIGEPAFGYATNVRRKGNVLMADFEDVPPQIVDAIHAKRYNAVSIELRQDVEHDGEVYPQVLSGVALLGAEWPAVKGLKPLYASAFSDDGGTTLTEKVEVQMVTFTQEQVDEKIAAAVAEVTAKFAAKLATAEAALAVFADEQEKKEIDGIIEAAEKAGKIVPASRPKVVAFAEKLRVTLSGSDRKAVITMFKEFVDGLPVRVEFKEQGSSANASERAGNEGAKAGEQVNAKVQAMIEAAGGPSKLSYKDALTKVFAADTNLRDAYLAENGSSSREQGPEASDDE